MSTKLPVLEIASQQVMEDDASVFSVQRANLPISIAEALSAEELLFRYIRYINKCSMTLIRPVILESGIEFRLLNSRLSLISFSPPVYTDCYAVMRICGGFLVQPRQCDRGELRFGVEHQSECVQVSLQLSDFCPLILGSSSPSLTRFLLYRATQATIHRLVTVRFLSLLYRELVGPSAGVRIVNIVVRAGKPV